MPPRSARSRLTLVFLAALLALPISARAASVDGNVEWSGISHVSWQDRRPLCPVSGESFQVRFQTWRNDLSSARLRIAVGATVSYATASKVGVRGPYDIWAATVPATAATTENYWIELTDGALTDYLSVNGLTHTAPVDGGFVLDFTTLAHAPAGATPVTGGGAVFKVWAPTRTSCYVRGAFNAWGMTNPLTKVGEYFIGRANAVADRSQYKFFFNNAVWNTDARARSLDAANGPYNANIENPFRYVWGDTAFRTPSFDTLVVYQLHVGTFSGRNDPAGATAFPPGYRDVAARAAHLAQLGVTAVQVNPFTEFPGDLSAGYNPITQWAPEWKYGTPDDLKYMVDVLHRNGIAVLLDIVWNHFSPTDNFLWNYDGSQTYFETPDVQTAWGSQAAFNALGVRDYFANSAQYWLEEFHLDGFRMDATSAMNPGVHAATGWALMQRLNNEKNARYADKITIAEQLPNNASITTPTASGGAGFDAQYHMQWRDNLRGAVFAAASGDPSMNNVRSALLGSGATISGTHALNYVQLHDEAWPSSGGQRMVKTIDTVAPHDDEYARGRTRLAEGLTLLSPAIPEFLQGDEWLEDTDFGADTPNRIDWSKKTTYATTFQFYQRLIWLRKRLPALRASASIYVSHVNEAGNVIAYRRYDGSGNDVLVIANFSNTDYTSYRLGVPVAGAWDELVNSQDPVYGGSGGTNPGHPATQAVSYDGYGQSLVLNVPRMGLLVLAPVANVGVGDAAPRGLRLAAPRPNPARGATTLAYTLAERGTVRLTVHDVAGRLVRVLAEGEVPAGEHEAVWDGGDRDGKASRPGLYFVRLAVGGQTRIARLTRLD